MATHTKAVSPKISQIIKRIPRWVYAVVIASGIIGGAAWFLMRDQAAITVNGDSISMERYTTYVFGLRTFYEKQQTLALPLPELDSVEMDAANRLIRSVLLEQLAEDYGVRITADDVAREYAHVVELQGDEETVRAFLNEWYGWTPEHYQELYVRPLLIAKKLQEHINSFPANAEIRKQMSEFASAIATGEAKFETIAADYSQDAAAGADGFIGVVSRNVFPREIGDQLIVMEPGTTTGVLDFGDSLQIIKVLDKDESQGTLQVARIYRTLATVEDEVARRWDEAKIISHIPDLAF